MSRPLALLLREAAPSASDPYERALHATGWDVAAVPVLTFEWVNEAALRGVLASPAAWEGMILTSPRAVDALAFVGLPVEWAGRTAWVVGEKTAHTAQKLGLQVMGDQSGTAAALAAAVIAATPAGARPWLFLCGHRRREALPTALDAARVRWVEQQVYRTKLRPPPLLPPGRTPAVVVFFSPSGVEAASADPSFPWDRPRAAIGPTTAAALAAAGFPAATIAATPDAAALAAALRPFHPR